VVLSAFLFIGLTYEVVWIKLDLGNLKTEILGEKCQKGREHPDCSPVARPPSRLWRVASWESSS